MANEVVDIRRRIEEMRNEVSAAIVSNRDLAEASRSIGINADISLTHSEAKSLDDAGAAEQQSSPPSEFSNSIISDETVKTYKALEMAAKMPTFQLNVRNQVSNRLLFLMVGIQLATNMLLILVLWVKLG